MPSKSIDEPILKNPFSLRVENIIQDSSGYHFKIRLESFVDYPSDKVVIGLNGLSSGRLVATKLQLLSDQLEGENLQKNLPVALYLNISSLDITEYQLELIWGDEALDRLNMFSPNTIDSLDKETLKVSQKKYELSNIIIKSQNPKCDSLQRESCSEVDGQTFVIIGDVLNTGDSNLQDITLALGINRISSDQVFILPNYSESLRPDEEEISIGGLDLKSGEKRSFEIEIDQIFKNDSDTKIIPYIRALDR